MGGALQGKTSRGQMIEKGSVWLQIEFRKENVDPNIYAKDNWH